MNELYTFWLAFEDAVGKYTSVESSGRECREWSEGKNMQWLKLLLLKRVAIHMMSLSLQMDQFKERCQSSEDGDYTPGSMD